jgi:Outer membrane protein beta-barrel domain
VKNLLIAITAVTASLALVQPARAEIGQNDIGPSVIFGNTGGTAFGVNSRFGIAKNLSVRPNVYFQDSRTTVGAAATYDFNLTGDNRELTPYIGAGVNFDVSNNSNRNNNATGYAIAGADYNLSDGLVLKGSVAIPFDSNNYSTTFGVGAGLRF